MSLLELMIASMLLILALGVFLDSLSSSQRSAAFQQNHGQTVDELRQATDLFAKDARQATSVTTATADTAVIATNVAGTPTTVTWKAVSSSGKLKLTRAAGSSPAQTVANDLLTTSVFVFTPTDPTSVTQILLTLRALPNGKGQEVDMSTEVALRNAL